ncbi:TetR/AcrR family transcriptional regulator [Novosphingobium capsulatum]|uniref:TetR/AcrR family transcriptional regulator n=1 Tax=Novosphingobium capsulatum TaxID=13688 RepID=UPI000A8FD75E|nr:TetR/AcrR family transcriptional regulator [Novosphingobium capsulatum]WQD91453.1 TetR/AcrR family transcriptional regulator [Novosphingobium capsulatum]
MEAAKMPSPSEGKSHIGRGMEQRPTTLTKPRRSQEERTIDSRRRIIDATIRCLYQAGYSGTSTAMIAKEAGVSRGNIFYHFATYADLMIAVRDAVYLEERQLIEDIKQRVGTRAYLEEAPRYVLAGMRREPAIAVDEIMLAARSDPELSAKLREKEKTIDERAVADFAVLYEELGIKPPYNLPILVRVSIAAFRGLAISELVQGPDAQIEECIDYLIHLLKIGEQIEPYILEKENGPKTTSTKC